MGKRRFWIRRVLSEDTVLGDQTYRYLTADEMKSLGDDSLPIDVTRDERIDSNRMVFSSESNMLPPQHIEDSISPEHVTQNYVEYIKKYAPDNVDIATHPINIGFLVSFLVDARGGAMRGCRHSGVRVIVPPRCAPSPTRITCRYVRPQRTPHPPPLMEGEALASRVLELGPVGAKFLGPVIIEVPHFAALRGKEREIVILRSDNGESWKEHTVEATEEILNEVLHDSFEAEDLNQLEDMSSGRITRILTQDFPQYFAVVSRVRQEVHAIGPEGGMVSSTVVPQVQAVFPEGALTKKIKVGLQAQPIDPELTAKLLGHGVAVSPVVTVEPRRRKFHKAITLSMPAPRAHSQGMINQYSGSAPTLRLLCSITGGTTRAQWEDVTGSTPLTFVNDCVSFTTTVSARFWLMDCRNIGDATKMATELYKEAIHVPFMAKFVVFAKRVDPLEARLRVFCMTDDKEDKTLEHQEHFTEVAKSRDVEVLEGKLQYVEFAGNLVPITKSGEQLSFSFRAFKENRLPFSVRVKDQHAEAVSRCLFMKESKVPKGEPPQQPICILNIVLPDDIVTDTISLTDTDSLKKFTFLSENFDYYRPDPRLADMSNLLGDDWVPLANQLGLTASEINVIKSEYPDSVAKQAQSMLRMWLSQSGNKAQTNTLENALRRIGREDIIPQCLNVDHEGHTITRIKHEEIETYRLKKDIDSINKEVAVRDEVVSRIPVSKQEAKKRFEVYDKYSAEEKAVEKSDEDEEEAFDKPVAERREKIEKRLSAERAIPASSQRREIVQEITEIKQQSLVEDKIAEVQQKVQDQVKTTEDQTKTTITKTITTITPDTKTVTKTVDIVKTTKPSESMILGAVVADPTEIKTSIVTEKRTTAVDDKTHKYADDTELLEGVTQSFEKSKKIVPKLIADEDPKSPKMSKTPPPSPADFLLRERAATIQEWEAAKQPHELESTAPKLVEDAAQKDRTSPGTNFVKYESMLLTPRRSISPPTSEPEYLHKTTSYTQIDTMLENMLVAVKNHEKMFGLDLDIVEDQYVNTLELYPTTDALIEVPIKKTIRKPNVYETTQNLYIPHTDEPFEYLRFTGNPKEEIKQYYDLIDFQTEESDDNLDDIGKNIDDLVYAVGNDERNISVNEEIIEKPYTYKIDFEKLLPSNATLNDKLDYEKATTASSETLSDRIEYQKASSGTLSDEYTESLHDITEATASLIENDYEVIENKPVTQAYHLYDNRTGDDIWWEGTYRNLSIVPEEEEENLSLLSSCYSNKIYAKNPYSELVDNPPVDELIPSECTLVPAKDVSIDHDETSDNSSSSASISSEEGSYDTCEKLVKAEVKLMVKTSERGKEAIEIRSVKEFMGNPDKNNIATAHGHKKLKERSQTLPNRLSEKFSSITNKFGSLIEKKKSSSYSMLTRSDDVDKKHESKYKQAFILPRIFIRSTETGNTNSNSAKTTNANKLFRTKSELQATSNERFPLDVNHIFNSSETSPQQVDLYANIPFYPCYKPNPNNFNLSSANPALKYRTSPFNYSSQVPQAYCDWLPQKEDSTGGDDVPSASTRDPTTSAGRAEGEETSEGEEHGYERKVTDQHQLSEEMKELLKELEKESKQ